MVALAAPSARAIVVIAADYPTAPASGATASNKSQLSQLVALYQNDVALLANSDKNYSEVIRKTKPDSAVQDKLRKLAAEDGGALTVESLALAVTAMIKATPENSNVILASAIALLVDLPGGPSQENRVVLGKAALLGVPREQSRSSYHVALIIGVSASGLEQSDITKTVIALRRFALGDLPDSRQIDDAVTLDGALVTEGILSPNAATEEFVMLARDFSPFGAETDAGSSDSGGEFSGSQGAINQGGSTGAGGGSGNTSDSDPTPTPTPSPTATPTPTPTPSPTPVS